MTGVSIGLLGKKVVPDYSSAIGDARERAETLQANHLEMCRFTGQDDPNYRKLSGEIRLIHADLVALHAHMGNRSGQRWRHRSPSNARPSHREQPPVENVVPSWIEVAILQSLRFPNMETWRRTLEPPAENTCLWLFKHKNYQEWLNGENKDEHGGLLWLKGKPGAGKSTLMKEAFLRASRHQARPDCWVAGFFFNAKGGDLEHSSLGLFRSLLYQLLSQSHERIQRLVNIYWNQKHFGERGITPEPDNYQESDLKALFHSIFATQKASKILIFIDSLDECSSKSVRPLAYYWREITKSAHAAGVNLNVCLSSRHFPTISLTDCPEIVVEAQNRGDIATYITAKLDLGNGSQQAVSPALRERIINKSAGIFL